MTGAVEQKAGRLLVNGRVRVVRAGTGFVRAIVEGDTGLHEVRRDGSRWACSCPARGWCSHLQAVANVTDPEPNPGSSRAAV